MRRQTPGANPRDVKPADLQALRQDCFGHLVLPVGLPHAQPVLSLPPRKPCGRRLERRWLDALDQTLTAIADQKLLDFLTQEASRETRQAFRLPPTAFFPRTLSNRLSNESKRTIDTRPHAPKHAESTLYLADPTCVVACHSSQMVGLHHVSI